MKLSPTVLAVVLNWNETDLTMRCLKSIRNQSIGDIDIFLVDNNSAKDPKKTFLDEFPELKFRRTISNIGVAGGRNIGIRYALKKGYEWVLLLDNDATIEPDMLSHIIDAARHDPHVGIFGPKILLNESPNIVWRAGCTSWKWTYLHAFFAILKRLYAKRGKPIPILFDTLRGENHIDDGRFDTEQDVDFQIGCAQVIRAKVFSDIGLLDEEYSPYGSEDIDFCARASSFGWRIRYVPKARCWHRATGSLQDEYLRNYYNTRNIVLLARKNLTPLYFYFLYLPDFLFFQLPLIMTESILQRKHKRFQAIVNAIFWNMADMKKRGIMIEAMQAGLKSPPPHKTNDSSAA